MKDKTLNPWKNVIFHHKINWKSVRNLTFLYWKNVFNPPFVIVIKLNIVSLQHKIFKEKMT